MKKCNSRGRIASCGAVQVCAVVEKDRKEGCEGANSKNVSTSLKKLLISKTLTNPQFRFHF